MARHSGFPHISGHGRRTEAAGRVPREHLLLGQQVPSFFGLKGIWGLEEMRGIWV